MSINTKTQEQLDREDFDRRSREDFNFMVLCESKGNHSMYQLLRDRDLDTHPGNPNRKAIKA